MQTFRILIHQPADLPENAPDSDMPWVAMVFENPDRTNPHVIRATSRDAALDTAQVYCDQRAAELQAASGAPEEYVYEYDPATGTPTQA